MHTRTRGGCAYAIGAELYSVITNLLDSKKKSRMIRPVEGPTICHLWAVVIQHLAIVVSKRKILAQPAQLKTSSDNKKTGVVFC